MSIASRLVTAFQCTSSKCTSLERTSLMCTLLERTLLECTLLECTLLECTLLGDQRYIVWQLAGAMGVALLQECRLH